ncbi:hypothetical protein DPMN_157275 [Dreissena polymorpha]|uniref:Uncharacterized protein n=1 Tax=Dreissena polymorpha TaxID=45954 RepID=A0A9D4EFM5_DREPO|nr:hypothetical protein DPMN_157275 [Dreissena polymorpha]
MRERKEREESRKEAQRTFMTRRLDEAQHLLGNILTDKPELPQEPAPRPVTTKQRMSSKDRSPASMRDRIPVKAQTAPAKETPQVSCRYYT